MWLTMSIKWKHFELDFFVTFIKHLEPGRYVKNDKMWIQIYLNNDKWMQQSQHLQIEICQ